MEIAAHSYNKSGSIIIIRGRRRRGGEWFSSSSCASCSKYGQEKKKRSIWMSSKACDVKVGELRELFRSCNLSPHIFPNIEEESEGGQVVGGVDTHKLAIALSHSSLVVSVYSTKPLFFPIPPPPIPIPIPIGWRRNGELVGFGRAVSDNSLTASIHDLMVLPSFQGLGIGRMILHKIISLLTNRGIYDISALCSPKQRLFFQACGFGVDILGSTTMMYTRPPKAHNTHAQDVKVAGRMLLLVPPSREQPPLSPPLYFQQ